MIRIDNEDVKQLESNFKTFARRALPFATKATVNSAAFKARTFAQENIREKMTLRNRFVERSIQVIQTKTLKISQQESRMGSTADFFEDQEFGGTKRRKGRDGVPIATAYASGQNGQQPRTRLPRKVNTLRAISLKRSRKARGSRRQRNTIAIKEAAESGNKFVFLDLGRTKGIFKVVGGKRRPRIKMVWDLTRSIVRIPKNPTIAPAANDTQALMPELYREALEFQARRNRLFGR